MPQGCALRRTPRVRRHLGQRRSRRLVQAAVPGPGARRKRLARGLLLGRRGRLGLEKAADGVELLDDVLQALPVTLRSALALAACLCLCPGRSRLQRCDWVSPLRRVLPLPGGIRLARACACPRMPRLMLLRMKSVRVRVRLEFSN